MIGADFCEKKIGGFPLWDDVTQKTQKTTTKERSLRSRREIHICVFMKLEEE